MHQRNRALKHVCSVLVALLSNVGVSMASDACGGAGASAIPSTGGMVMGTVVGATPDGSGCGVPLLPGADVYYSFIPSTAGPWRFDLCMTDPPWDTGLSIHRHPTTPTALACPTSPANRVAGGCDDDGCGFPFAEQTPSRIGAISLVPGVVYTIRIAGFDANSVVGDFALEVTDLGVVNDRCVDAAQAAIPGTGGVVTGSIASATTEGAVSATTCLGSFRAGTARDVFHEFVPATSGRWTFSTCVAGNSADTVVSIHSGCPANAGNVIACNNDGCEDVLGASVVSANLTAGVTYVVRIAQFLADRFETPLGATDYALEVTSFVMGRCCSNARGTCSVVAQTSCGTGNTFTANAACTPVGFGAAGACSAGSYNACSQAITLSLDTPVITSTSGLTGTAQAACTGLTSDGWFRFTAPVTGSYVVTSDQLTFFSPVATIVSVTLGNGCSGTPGSEIECGFGQGLAFNLNAGQSVRIRVASSGPALISTMISAAIVPPPVNDLCGNATVLTRNVLATGSLVGATGALPLQTCGGGGRDVWFSYTAPNSGRTVIAATPAAGSMMTLGLTVSTTCANASDPFVCASEFFVPEKPVVVTFQAVAGTTYRIRISTGSEPGSFGILVNDAPAAPINDACGSATALAIGATPTGSTAFALGSAGLISGTSCSNPSDPDVWYRFTAPTTGTFELTVTPESFDDAAATPSIFAGCPSAGAEAIACGFAFGGGSPSTVAWLAQAGVEYLIRVSTPTGESASFSIEAQTSATALGACCAREGGCQINTSLSCTGFGGVYAGDNTVCQTAGCAPQGRCCVAGSAACAVTAQALCTGAGATFTVNATCEVANPCGAAAIPPNDVCTAAINVSIPGSILGTNELADAEGPGIPGGFCGTSQALDLGLDHSVYYRFIAPSTGTLNVDVQRMDYPFPMLVLYEGPSCNALVDVGCFVGFQAGERRSFAVVGGREYRLGVGLRNDPDLTSTGGVFGFALAMEASTGACCRGTACIVESVGACVAPGVFQGSGSVCGPAGNPTTCCKANFDLLGGVTVQDIFGFLNAWFANDPAADFNGGGLGVSDIFDYLNAWFAGC